MLEKNKHRILLAHKLNGILSRVYKLEFQRSGQAFFQSIWRNETGRHGLDGIELGGGAELLDADREDEKILAGDQH